MRRRRRVRRRMLKRENKIGWTHARLNEANLTLMRTRPFLFDHFTLELPTKTIPP